MGNKNERVNVVDANVLVLDEGFTGLGHGYR